MANLAYLHPSDALGFSRLAIDATSGMAEVVEAMHQTIAGAWTQGTPAHTLLTGTAGMAYLAVRAITKLVGGGMDAVFTPLIPMLGTKESRPEREAMLAVVNGILGDHLAATENPLAIRMNFRRSGRPLQLERQHLAAAFPRRSGKLLVLVHGLCMNDLQWTRAGHNHGTALAREAGWTPVHLHYNSGLHVSTNGRSFADLIEKLVTQWPVRVRELAIVGHSGGGLISRSAYHYGLKAGHRWPEHLKKLVFLATPHHGSAVERGGNLVNVALSLSPYSAPLARVARIRSAGITDLRYGNVIDEDWAGIDHFHHSGDRRHAVPLPEEVRCFAIAAHTGKNSSRLHHELGDGLVSVNSALGRHKDPRLHLSFAKSRQWVGSPMNHWDLLSHPSAYTRIRGWLADERQSGRLR